MTNLERLKLQLSNKKYFSDTEYTVFLEENNLVANEQYNKETNQIKLLQTCVTVLEILENDVDLMRKLANPDILSTSQAYKYINTQIQNINSKIITLKEEENNGTNIKPLWFN